MLRAFKVFKKSFDVWYEAKPESEYAQELFINMCERWEEYLHASKQRTQQEIEEKKAREESSNIQGVMVALTKKRI